jgi:hypothetical protein
LDTWTPNVARKRQPRQIARKRQRVISTMTPTLIHRSIVLHHRVARTTAPVQVDRRPVTARLLRPCSILRP